MLTQTSFCTGGLGLSRLIIQLKNSTSDTPSDCVIRYPVTASADSYTDIYCDHLSSTKLISITGSVSDITALSEVQVYGARKFTVTIEYNCWPRERTHQKNTIRHTAPTPIPACLRANQL